MKKPSQTTRGSQTHSPRPSEERKKAAMRPYKGIPPGDIRAIQRVMRKNRNSSGCTVAKWARRSRSPSFEEQITHGLRILPRSSE
jgi:hypothetical protein